MAAKTPSALKVFYGYANRSGSTKLVRMLVAAPSRLKAIEALNAHGVRMSASYLKDFWSITGNGENVALATSQPGRVFASSGSQESDFKLLPLQDGTGDN